ncbi:MAG: NADH-quinone oxidoreductase subunit NuoG [Burkholderiaceae bacterium]
MVEIEIDGKKVEVAEGSMVMHAANKLGVYVPHFCYHKKLSIAANCRMCLVEVEKAPKPLPACATPVSAGMKVFTHSEKAVNAQKSVMEFLLINHPLDCPICDQGGECQLQDLAVGYGGSSSPFSEEKRVVFHKPMGPLVSAEEMSRCIHCTRCVRFGQEVAGVMELGMANRGEHAEIMTFVGQSIDSELSGNMIDICPVGALTSKPFRYSARTWELSRRKTIAAHDSLGSNIVAQIKGSEVMRVVPLENNELNECWISDRDRFSYEGLVSEERLTEPMIKRDGKWQVTGWDEALGHAALALATARVDHGSEKIAGLAAPQSTFEELFLMQRLVRAMGSDNIDFRLRHSNFDIDAHGGGAPWLGMPVQAISSLDAMLLVGSFLRKDHPVLSARMRESAQHGMQLSVIHATDDDLLMPVAHKLIVGPSQWKQQMLEVLAAALLRKGRATPAEWSGALNGVVASDRAGQIVDSLCSGEFRAVVLGNAAVQHPQAGDLMRIGHAIADLCEASFGVIGEAANSVGGYLAGATPRAVGAMNATALGSAGLNVQAQIGAGMRGVVLLNVEPGLDIANGASASAAMKQADVVVALSAFQSPELLEVASVLLPVSPFTETGGSFVNTEGRLQAFNGVVRPLGQARPAWKVFRVLGNKMDLPGFDFDSVEDVRVASLTGGDKGLSAVAASASSVGAITGPQARVSIFEGFLDNLLSGEISADRMTVNGIERIADIPIYSGDPLVRRAKSLQLTRDARAPRARMHSQTAGELGLDDADSVSVSVNGQRVIVPLSRDNAVAPGTLHLAAAHPSTAGLDGLFGTVNVERA